MTLPLSFSPPMLLRGADWEEVASFYPAGDPVRQIERASIRRFVELHAGNLRGRVLDFGAGKQPYRDLVHGEYIPMELGDEPGKDFDAILCTQVMQYLAQPGQVLEWFWEALKPSGYLVMTYPTNWPEVEAGDFWRFTKRGMDRLLRQARFSIHAHELRAEVVQGSNKFALGYGVVAQK
ncbi:MAG TPA: methyltransferase domain-containing protein [Bryobacteraceae bacterium]|nr:methyltransferase domain-containing protein [Blastocatellia bacterium]HXJ40532.1 methyltransferase domain-containing protein [Bryobacteraceae bacterium]